MKRLIICVLLIFVTLCSCSTIPYTEVSGEENKTAVSREMGDILYVANTKSFTYHLPSCYLAKRITDDNRWETYDREILERDSFKPCKICQK